MPKGGKIINLLGQKFGMVTAIEIMGKNKSGNYTRLHLFRKFY